MSGDIRDYKTRIVRIFEVKEQEDEEEGLVALDLYRVCELVGEQTEEEQIGRALDELVCEGRRMSLRGGSLYMLDSRYGKD